MKKKLVFQLQSKLAIAKNKLSPQNHNRLDPNLLSQSADGQQSLIRSVTFFLDWVTFGRFSTGQNIKNIIHFAYHVEVYHML